LDEVWPTELTGVVANLNTLLTAERTRIARYRDTLGNLAHSLKTPLAVLRATFTPGSAGAEQVNEQVDRMSAIVEHQLRRAATSGGASVGKQAVPLLPVAQDLRSAMLKAHGRKDFALELAVPEALLFVGDRDDLTEALGNLMDNAAKWCRSQVRVQANLEPAAGASQKLRIAGEDDGPGIAAGDRARVIERGMRADEHTPSHGLGLAMVRDMAELYGGRLDRGESALGGARITLQLPGRLRRASMAAPSRPRCREGPGSIACMAASRLIRPRCCTWARPRACAIGWAATSSPAGRRRRSRCWCARSGTSRSPSRPRRPRRCCSSTT